MAYDANQTTVLCPAAADPVDMRQFSGNRVTVYVKAAGDVAVESAPADEADNCIPQDDWTPVQTTDACGDESKTDLIVTITEDDIANGNGICYFTVDCIRDFVRFDADVVLVGARRSNRPAVNYGCGPTIVN